MCYNVCTILKIGAVVLVVSFLNLQETRGWVIKYYKMSIQNVGHWHGADVNLCYFNKCIINSIGCIPPQVSWGACHKQHKALGAGVCLQAGAERLLEPKGVWGRRLPLSAASTDPTNGGLDQPLHNEARLCHTHCPQLWRPPKGGDPNNLWICGSGHAALQFVRWVH